MTPKLRRWNWLGVVGVVLLILAGCASADTNSETASEVVESEVELPTEEASEEPADDPEDPAENSGEDATEESDEEPVEEASSEPAGDPSAPFGVDAVFDESADRLLDLFTPFEPGTYRTASLGTPMSFTATEALSTQPNGGGHFVVSDISSRAPDDRGLVFFRVSAFSDPDVPNSPIEEQTGWPSDDFRGWLENLNDGVIASDSVDTTINGLPAIRVDLRLDESLECGWLPGTCAGLASSPDDIKGLNQGASYRVWVVEMADEDPLLISADIPRDEDADWFDRAEAVLDTVAFGEIEPNPVTRLAPGANVVTRLGRVTLDHQTTSMS